MLIPKNNTTSLYDHRNCIKKTKTALTSDNFAHEGRTEVNHDSFDRKEPLRSEYGAENLSSQKKQRVTRGQTEVKGHPEEGRILDYNSITPNPKGHFVLKLLEKY